MNLAIPVAPRAFLAAAAMLALAGCTTSTASTRPHQPAAVPSVTYELLEAAVPLSEGRHSASFYHRTQTGSLDVFGNGSVTGSVKVTGSRSYIVCPPGSVGGIHPTVPRQACTPAARVPKTPKVDRTVFAIRGTAIRAEDGALTMELSFVRSGDSSAVAHAGLSCRPDTSTADVLNCRADDRWPVRGLVMPLQQFDIRRR